MNVISRGLRPMPINRRTVPPHCSHGHNICFYFTLEPLLFIKPKVSNVIQYCFYILMTIKWRWIYNAIWFFMSPFVFYTPFSITILPSIFEGMSFITFVWRSLYPKGNNVSKDEGHWYLTFYVALFLIHSTWEQVTNRDPIGYPRVWLSLYLVSPLDLLLNFWVVHVITLCGFGYRDIYYSWLYFLLSVYYLLFMIRSLC
jgi:hypothetical protein